MDTTDQANPSEHAEPCHSSPLAERMHAGGCDMEQILRLIADKWTLMIVYLLLSGARRFGELLEAMGSVSPKTVSQRLKMLEEANLVERQAYAEIPPRVEYRLTEKGAALGDIIKAIESFGERYFATPEPRVNT
jgi:DNA-binding HxlR family transcriptional regulator